MTRIKICGITTPEDARAACRAGADAIGLVFAESLRRVPIERAREVIAATPALVNIVGVFLNQSIEQVTEIAAAVGLDTVQLHGDEPAEMCAQLRPRVIKRFNVEPGDTLERLAARMRPYRVSGYLLDPGTGSGRTFDWSVAQGIGLPLIVSGGLNAGNVGAAIRALRPYAVDVSSGIESSPGRKDAEQIREFVHRVRKADATNAAG
jgi:phosphoribosylanthranilate isomerase